MAGNLHAAAPHHLPSFVPGADGSDHLMAVTAVVLLAGVLAAGVVFLWIHSIPERMAHRSRKVQMEIVAVLCLLALLTHIHAFWVVALLLAMVDIPSLANPVERIAGSLERIAGRDAPPPADPPDPAGPPEPPGPPDAAPDPVDPDPDAGALAGKA